MLRVFEPGQARVRELRESDAIPEAAAWIDMMTPSAAEEHRVETFLDHGVPTREEMQEIEASSRLYRRDRAVYMTATLLYQAETAAPTGVPVTFILVDERLVTVRYAEVKAIATFAAAARRQPQNCGSGLAALVCLLEAIVDRLADVLEIVSVEDDRLSSELFRRRENERPGRLTRTLEELVVEIGVNNTRASKARESLLSLIRLVRFLRTVPTDGAADIAVRVETLAEDIHSLLDHTTYLTGHISFLLDASLGLINIEQNGIIKIFSVMAVVFLPPTLVASIYGMNFEFIPELTWTLGYPWALGLMVLSAVLPYVLFKRKGWL